jgi:hypothetical protein
MLVVSVVVRAPDDADPADAPGLVAGAPLCGVAQAHHLTGLQGGHRGCSRLLVCCLALRAKIVETLCAEKLVSLDLTTRENYQI